MVFEMTVGELTVGELAFGELAFGELTVDELTWHSEHCIFLLPDRKGGSSQSSPSVGFVLLLRNSMNNRSFL